MNRLFKFTSPLVLIAAVYYLFNPVVAAWIMAVGAAGVAIAHLTEVYTGSNFRLKRIYRTRRIIALFYLAASYFMFHDGLIWVPLLLSAAVIELYTLFVINSEEK